MPKILAIDPGYKESAWVTYDTVRGEPIAFKIELNEDVLASLASTEAPCSIGGQPVSWLAVEMIAHYGMSVGVTVFDTCVWIGRFIERWPGSHILVYRKDVKMFLCQSMRAKDSNIRQALIDRFGPGKDKAIGLKKSPGPLYGFKKDLWAALAVAVTAAHQMEEKADG